MDTVRQSFTWITVNTQLLAHLTNIPADVKLFTKDHLAKWGISPTECNTGTTQELSCGVSTMIYLKNVRTTSNSTGTLISQNIPS